MALPQKVSLCETGARNGLQDGARDELAKRQLGTGLFISGHLDRKAAG